MRSEDKVIICKGDLERLQAVVKWAMHSLINTDLDTSTRCARQVHRVVDLLKEAAEVSHIPYKPSDKPVLIQRGWHYYPQTGESTLTTSNNVAMCHYKGMPPTPVYSIHGACEIKPFGYVSKSDVRRFKVSGFGERLSPAPTVSVRRTVEKPVPLYVHTSSLE